MDTPFNSMALTICLILIPALAKAEKFAVVVSGPALSRDPQGIFSRLGGSIAYGLRQRGDYNLTFLLGDEQGKEQARFSEEYNYLRRTAKVDGGATEENLDSALAKILANAKKDDQVELFIGSHGFCGGNQCDEHVFGLYDKDGKSVSYHTTHLLKAIRVLDDRGVKVNLTVNACYSGAIDQVARTFRHACIMTIASPDAVAFACVGSVSQSTEGAVEPHRATTITAEYMGFRYYQNVLSDLEQGYYRDDRCLKGVANAARNMAGADFSTMEGSFWSGLLRDRVNHRPMLNTLTQETYDLARVLDRRNTVPICSPAIQSAVLNVKGKVFSVLHAEYKSAISKYQNLLDKQRGAIEERKEKLEELARRPECQEYSLIILNPRIAQSPDSEVIMSEEEKCLGPFRKINQNYAAATAPYRGEMDRISESILKIERNIMYGLQASTSSGADERCRRPL